MCGPCYRVVRVEELKLPKAPEPTPTDLRTCKKCHTAKPLEDFAKDHNCKLGRTWTCRKCAVARADLWWKNNPDRHRANGRRTMRNRRVRARQAILAGYGGRCACCGETEPVFLALDHVNEDGKQHRSKFATSLGVYSDVIKRGFPKDFQLLCHNCNMAKSLAGECPHETRRREQTA